MIVATGVSYRTLDLPDAERLAGAGVYYGAATTEAVLYRDAEVGVVGGGNSAGQAVGLSGPLRHAASTSSSAATRTAA